MFPVRRLGHSSDPGLACLVTIGSTVVFLRSGDGGCHGCRARVQWFSKGMEDCLKMCGHPDSSVVA